MTKDLPLVTIRTPVYNTGRFVVQGLAGVKAQNYSNIQHIIVDDASTDDSVELIENWIRTNNYKCTFIKHNENKGLVFTLNEINTLALGKYITGLADDIWEPNRLLTQVRILEEAGESCALVYSDMIQIDEDNNVVADSHFLKKGWKNIESMPSGKVSLMTYLEKSFIPAPSVMLRMSSLRAVGGYDPNLFTEDVDMWAKLLQKFEVRYSNQKFVRYRIRQGSMSNDKGNVWKVHQTHLFIWPKYLSSLKGLEKEVLLKKILHDIVRYYRATGDKELCLNVIRNAKEHTRALIWDKLSLYIRTGLPKRYVGYLVLRK